MVRTNALEDAMKGVAQKDPWEKFALQARYDTQAGMIIVSLGQKVELRFDPGAVQELESASPRELANIVISPSGRGLHFPLIDADVFLPTLLMGLTGTKSWMAANLGKTGGQIRSSAKAKASRKNGLLGGRPRKTATIAQTDTPKLSPKGKKPRSVHLSISGKLKTHTTAKHLKRG